MYSQGVVAFFQSEKLSLVCIEFEQQQQLGWWFQESEGLGVADIMDSVGLRTQVHALLENRCSGH